MDNVVEFTPLRTVKMFCKMRKAIEENNPKSTYDLTGDSLAHEIYKTLLEYDKALVLDPSMPPECIAQDFCFRLVDLVEAHNEQ